MHAQTTDKGTEIITILRASRKMLVRFEFHAAVYSFERN